MWIDHQDDFESLLSNLSKNLPTNNQDTQPVVQSLEQKSKQSKARLHYKKFAKSKDLSMVSQNDLNCILGNKTSLKQQKAESDNNSSDVEGIRPSFNLTQPVSTPETKKPSEYSLQFSTNTMSIGDYFAKKMADKNKTVEVEMTKVEENRVLVEEKEEIVEEEIVAENGVEEIEEEKKKKPKNKLKRLMKKSFKGSNFFDIYGYSSYYINSTVEQALNEKQKRLNRKRNILAAKLEIDPNFYEMNKKMNC